MKTDDYKRFADLTFDDFRRMAGDDALSPYERIGFPDSYREGREEAIFEDITSKLTALASGRGKVVLDVGPGCSGLPLMLYELCRRQGHTLLLVDSAEMLARLPDEPFARKFAAYYPRCDELFAEYAGRVDVLLSYSVLHYVFAESNLWDFLDASLALLAPGGQMLVGDIPNVSKRRRFFSSDAGVLSLVMRARAAGCDAYVVPQRDDLPMANRREDIFVRKP